MSEACDQVILDPPYLSKRQNVWREKLTVNQLGLSRRHIIIIFKQRAPPPLLVWANVTKLLCSDSREEDEEEPGVVGLKRQLDCKQKPQNIQAQRGLWCKCRGYVKNCLNLELINMEKTSRLKIYRWDLVTSILQSKRVQVDLQLVTRLQREEAQLLGLDATLQLQHQVLHNSRTDRKWPT